jgi:NADH-quinone oxidoreductase subunit N
MKVFGALTEQWEMMMYIVIVLTITIGNLFAMRQSELKRFMAFSSISQAGYIMLAVIGNSSMGVASLMFYTLVYVAANLAVFAVISVVEQNNGGTTERSALAGFYETNPRLSLLMTLALFSLAGIPPFAGMFSKFFVFMAAAQQGSFWAYFVVFIALINTVPSLYYYLLIVKEMYIKKTATPLPAFQSDSATKLALALCTVGIVLFGVCSCIYEWLNSVAAV